MTKAAQAFGKRLQDFMDNMETKRFMHALSSVLNNADRRELTIANKGRYGGTWGHPKLAVKLACWLDPYFEVACMMMIEDILKGSAEVTIVKPEESSVMKHMDKLPQMFSELTAVLQQMNKREEAMAKRLEAQGQPTHFYAV